MVTFANRAKVSTSTTGTGAITLGAAVDGYQSFSDAGLTGSDTVRYTIEDGYAWEIGTGGINGAVTTMSRTLIESSTGSKLNLSGDAVVYVTVAGEDIVQPSDLATVATSGAYSDLSGLPTLGTAAAADTGDFATAAQGSLADSAVQPNDSPSFGSVTVSGTVDGRDIAADGSKLDGIEAGATADQTASEILTSIKTVDGAGSGLDADLLDGIHASSFLQGNQTITLSGDVSGSGTTSISVTVADDSHNHIIGNVDGLQAALDGKLSTTGKAADSNLLDGLDSTAFYLASNPNGYTTNVGDITGVTAGSGITGGGTSGTVTISHADTSSQGSVNNSGATVIQDITLDTYGHVTGLGSKALTAADVGAITGNQTITLSGDVSGSGTTSISVTVADDSHNHVISNVDGLQTALDGKLSTSGKAADSELLDGIDSSAFLRSNTADTFTTLSGTQLNIGSQVQLAESSDRADLLAITSSTSGWAGLQIRNSSNEGRWSFMTDGESAGIYNDEDNQWHIYMTEGQGVELRHASTTKLATTSSGISLSGQIDMNNNDIVGVDQIIHEGDSNTYIQFHAADQWRVVTGGAERLEVNNSQITSTEPIHAPSFHGDGSALTGIAAASTVIYVAQNTAPTGYLKANGAAISRATYADLFAAIGTTFGSGNGSTTFNVPDLRGEFVRGWDDGRGVDSGRAFGSAQLDQMQKITGSFRIHGDASTPVSGAFSISRDVNLNTWGSGGGDTDSVSFDSSNSPSARVSSTTSGETRSRNVALLACIKY